MDRIGYRGWLLTCLVAAQVTGTACSQSELSMLIDGEVFRPDVTRSVGTVGSVEFFGLNDWDTDLELRILQSLDVGTHPVGDPQDRNNLWMELEWDGGFYTSVSGQGEVTITERSDTMVRGAFDLLLSGDGPDRQVTDGSFRMRVGDLEAPSPGGGGSATRFTCASGSVCVEYTITDAGRAAELQSQCGSYTDGHTCSRSNAGTCHHTNASNGDSTCTVTTDPPGDHDAICTSNGGTPGC